MRIVKMLVLKKSVAVAMLALSSVTATASAWHAASSHHARPASEAIAGANVGFRIR